MKAAVRRRGLTHAQLASQLGINRPSVTPLLNGTYGKIPQSLLKALDALGLEITVVESPNADDADTARAKTDAIAQDQPMGQEAGGP